MPLKLLLTVFILSMMSIQPVLAQAICPDVIPADVALCDDEVCGNDSVNVSLFNADEPLSLANLASAELTEGGVLHILTDQAEYVAFGEMDIQFLDPPFVSVDVTLTSRGRLRSTPDSSSDYNVVDALDAGNTLTAFGRTDASDWLHIFYEDGAAWVSTLVVSAADWSSLPVTDIDAEIPTFPLTHVAIQTASPCAGLLVQTNDEGDDDYAITINDFDIWMASAAWLQQNDDAFSLTLLNGAASVRHGEQAWYLVGGTQVSVNNADLTGEVVSNPITASTLPLAAARTPVTPAPSVPQAEIPQAVSNVFAPSGVIANGYWAGYVTVHQGAGQVCQRMRSPGGRYAGDVTASGNTISSSGGIVHVRSSSGTYHFTDERNWTAENYSVYRSTLTIVSPFSMIESITYDHTDASGTYNCRYQLNWTYVRQ
jgi:hypothetical protein